MPEDGPEPEDAHTFEDEDHLLGAADLVADEEVDVPEFDAIAWEPVESRYGFTGLLTCRQAMLPIKKPQEMRHIKLLIVAGLVPAFDDGEDDEKDRGRTGPNRPGGGGKGKGKGRGGGRNVPDMGRTEVLLGTQRGTWWRNITDSSEVVVREGFSLQSTVLWSLPSGQYVQQGGPVEVMVTGQAEGLQRMPVLPRGWVTVDATAVGGPRYLEKASTPSWRVVFTSGSSKGDIVVREAVSLESEEVAVLWAGDVVDQNGPREVLEDGIVRMPVSFREAGQLPQSPPTVVGWVTIDATAQGGPKFFEAAPDSKKSHVVKEAGRRVPEKEAVAESRAPAPTPVPESEAEAAAQEEPKPVEEPKNNKEPVEDRLTSWSRNRIWKVTNLPADSKLPVVTRAGPFGPGSTREPPEDTIIKTLQTGDKVEQVGHSKKVRGYKVMPVQVEGKDGSPETGWVVQRFVDKTRGERGDQWFEDVTRE